MKEQVIFIQGSVSGYFDHSYGYESGNYKFNDLHLHSVDVRNSYVIEDTLIDEHCVGSYYKPTAYHDVRIFTSDSEFFKARLREFVIRDIQTERSLQRGDKKFIPYSGTFISCLKRPMPLEEKNELEIDFSERKVKKEPDGGSNNPGCGGRYFGPIFTSLFRLKNTEGERLYAEPSFLEGFIGLSIFSALFIGLASFFGLALYGVVLSAFVIVAVVWDSLKHKLNWLGVFDIRENHFFLYTLSLILWLIAIPSILLNGWQFGNFHLFLFGLWMFLMNRKMNFLKLLAWGVLLFQLFYFIGQVQKQMEKSDDSDAPVYIESDDDELLPESYMDSSTVISETDTVNHPFFVHKMKWKDYRENIFNGTFKIRKDHFFISKINREQLVIDEVTPQSYWFKVYSRLANEKSEKLDLIYQEYLKIIKKKNLNRAQAADMIVTSIQNIPYYLVHELSHVEADRLYGGFIQEYHRTGGPCLPNIKFGLQSPTEFMGNFKGDCDTRSVLLYALLNRFGYKTIVLASDHYGHAIIGVTGNYRGKAVRYKGENYYTWETTATGFRPGVLSDECGNLKYWYVALGK